MLEQLSCVQRRGKPRLYYASNPRPYCPASTKCARRFSCQHCSPDSVQNGFSLPKLVVVTRLAATPADTNACFADCARLSPSDMLYSVEPRSSQWPSTRIFQVGC